MRQVGELARPLLDFPSLSVKIPPNYRITGDLGCGRRVGPILMQQAPTPLPNCGALGLEAAGSSHTRGVGTLPTVKLPLNLELPVIPSVTDDSSYSQQKVARKLSQEFSRGVTKRLRLSIKSYPEI